MTYIVQPYTFRQARKLGVYVKASRRANYKIDVFNKDGDYLFSGGSMGYSDYPTYLKERGKDYADERRRLYHIRHKNESARGRAIAFLLW